MSSMTSINGGNGNSPQLDTLISSARELDAPWDIDRSERVRTGALRRRDARVRHNRLLRRGLLVASGAGLLVIALLRAASSAPANLATSSGSTTGSGTSGTSVTAPAPTADVLAARADYERALADAGYARD